MAIDYAATLYDPIYDLMGVAATLDLASVTATLEVTALDKTDGVEVGSEVQARTIEPAAAVRMAELTAHGVTLADLFQGTITMNGKAWTIRSHMSRPAPTGEGQGEVLLLLHEKA